MLLGFAYVFVLFSMVHSFFTLIWSQTPFLTGLSATWLVKIRRIKGLLLWVLFRQFYCFIPLPLHWLYVGFVTFVTGAWAEAKWPSMGSNSNDLYGANLEFEDLLSFCPSSQFTPVSAFAFVDFCRGNFGWDEPKWPSKGFTPTALFSF